MTVAPGLQRPMPSHENVPTTASPSQVPALHIVPGGCLRQRPAPSQVPSRPQPLAAEATHVLAVRGLPPGWMPMHMPADSSAVQVMQPSVQAVLQQTPSTQKPLAQSAAQAQAWPLILPLPASQVRASGRWMRTSLSAAPLSAPSIVAASRSPCVFPDLQLTATTRSAAIPVASPPRLAHPAPARNRLKIFTFFAAPAYLFRSSTLARCAQRHPPTYAL